MVLWGFMTDPKVFWNVIDNSCNFWTFTWFVRGFSFEPGSCKIWLGCACVHIGNKNRNKCRGILLFLLYYPILVLKFSRTIEIICAWSHSIMSLDKLGIEHKTCAGWWDVLWQLHAHFRQPCLRGWIDISNTRPQGILRFGPPSHLTNLATLPCLNADRLGFKTKICTRPVCCSTTVHAISWRATCLLLWIAIPTRIPLMQK